jgi:hypothetical protein
VSRSSRLSWLVRQMREEIVDLAEVKYARKIQEGNERCIIHALSSAEIGAGKLYADTQAESPRAG